MTRKCQVSVQEVLVSDTCVVVSDTSTKSSVNATSVCSNAEYFTET